MSDQEEMDTLDLDENGCAPDCPIRILGEQSGERGKTYRPNQTVHLRQNQTKNVYGEYYEDTWVQGERGYNDQGTAARYFAQFYPDSSGDLDENGCAPDCPIRILGEQSGVSKSDAHIRHNGKGRQGYGINNRAFETSGVVDQGTASRYFKTFRPMVDDPDDETPQERGETQLLNSDDSQYDELPIDQVIHGDCLEALKTLPDNSVDAICTDPPYGMGTVKDIAGLLLAWIQDEDDSKHLGKSGFMGKEWDAGVPGPRYWREALRVLKPGGHILAFSSTRTYDLLVIALKLAGFECRDQIDWIHGQGFPKSADTSKQIDRLLGKERQMVGYDLHVARRHSQPFGQGAIQDVNIDTRAITAPATPESARFSGWGSALKPSHEPICLARKPLAENTIAAQVLATGTGALNIDISRIGGSEQIETGRNGRTECKSNAYGNGLLDTEKSYHGKRFPSNTLFSHSPACVALGEKRVRANGPACTTGSTSTKNAYGEYSQRSNITHRDEDGMETVAAYSCAPDCPVRVLDQQSGVLTNGGGVRTTGTTRNVYTPGMEVSKAGDIHASYGDKGGASRYFKTFPPVEDMVPFTYQSKASRKDRSSNGAVNNTHPTCKPLSLMKYLCNMVCPPGGIVLDMFGGSGTTALACIAQGFRYILVEAEQEYVDIARARIAHAHASVSRPVEQEAVEYDCAPGCPVAELGEMSGVSKSTGGTGIASKQKTELHGWKPSNTGGKGDQGTAARFFKTFPPEPTLWDIAEEEAPS